MLPIYNILYHALPIFNLGCANHVLTLQDEKKGITVSNSLSARKALLHGTKALDFGHETWKQARAISKRKGNLRS